MTVNREEVWFMFDERQMNQRQNVSSLKPSTKKCILTLLCMSTLHHHPTNAFHAPNPGHSTVTKLQPLTSPRMRKVEASNPITACHATARNSTKLEGPTTTLVSRKEKIPSPKKSSRSKGDGARTVGSKFISDAMLNHEILTKTKENELGYLILRAKNLRLEIKEYLLQKELEKNGYGSEGKHKSQVKKEKEDTVDDGSMKLDKDLWAELQLDKMYSQSIPTTDFLPSVDSSPDLPELDASMHEDISSLSDSDILTGLSIPGGRSQLIRILEEGVTARRTLLSCNIKLVTSIARAWMRRATTSNRNKVPYTTVYKMGTWNLPSLDDAIHEGIIGLTRAADKYEPGRGTKFSTYATYWITSYVRQCFYEASTGSLRLPQTLHIIKQQHQQIVRRHRDLDLPPPTLEEAANEIGVNQNRLLTALQATQSLVSLDGEFSMSSKKGSGAGMGDEGDVTLTLSETLCSSEPSPSEFVERSILRQCLENAMASELSPHERDILRLRLGLDDGHTRTHREVVDVCGGSISVADVKSVERRAFKKLRAPNTVHAHNLMAFLEDVEHDAYCGAGRVRW